MTRINNMTYIYESIESGVFNFTIPGEDKRVTLFRGSRVTVKQKLNGAYLKVLRLVQEIEDAPVVVTNNLKSVNSQTKLDDKITKVETIDIPHNETLQTVVSDDVVVNETENTTQPTVKRSTKKK